MSRRAAPSMPTIKQIRDASDLVSKLYPKAKIHRIGPDGVTFAHDEEVLFKEWKNKPFSADEDENE